MTAEEEQNRIAWLEERKKSIGASETSAILGINHWSSALKVWLEKTGEVENDEDENGRLEAGMRSEMMHLKWFADLVGHPVKKAEDFKILYHKKYKFISCTPDAYIKVDEKVHLVELKTASEYMTDSWANGPPLYYWTQCQHQMLVTGMDRCHLSVMVGWHRPKYWVIARDERFITNLEKKLCKWWHDHIVNGERPMASGNETAQKVLAFLYPRSKPKQAIKLPESWKKDRDRLLEVAEEIKALEEEKADLQAMFKDNLEDAQFALFEDGTGVRWSGQKRRAFGIVNVEPKGCEFVDRVLRRRDEK